MNKKFYYSPKLNIDKINFDDILAASNIEIKDNRVVVQLSEISYGECFEVDSSAKNYADEFVDRYFIAYWQRFVFGLIYNCPAREGQQNTRAVYPEPICG